MNLLRSAMVCVGVLIVVAAQAACSAGAGPTDDGPEGTGASAGPGGPGAGNQGGAGTGASGFGGDVGQGGVINECPNTCSADLHQILDCEGNVLVECPPDQGCGADGCVAPCESAKQNQSTIGCDYYVVAPDTIMEAAGGCFAAFVANTWDTPVSLTLSRAGQTFDGSSFARIPSGSGQNITYAPLPEGQIPPGEVAIVFLSRFGVAANACPPGITPAYVAADASIHGTGIGQAFRLETSSPVVAYDIYPYGGGISAAASATLLIPTTAWDDNYMAVTAFRKSTVVQTGNPFLEIVAAEDDTTVTIRPTSAIVGGVGVQSAAAGVPQSYQLDRGQVLQLSQPSELVGSPIESDKPIGVWGGASCLNIDVASVACDAAHQQIPPVQALGSEYVALRYRNRFEDQAEESPPWRIVGAVDGTTLSYTPSAPAGAPATLQSGQVAEFRASGPFIVRSQDADHPFYMSGHMTGCQEVNPTFNDCRGDPEFVNVIPSAQFLDSYVFFTDPTYPETNLLVTRRALEGTFHEVTLDCYGPLDGWQAVPGALDYEYTRIDMVRGNFEKQGECDNGRHEIESAAPFGLTVWGWGSAATGGDFTGTLPGLYSQAVSYAYPSGASVKPINTVELPPTPR